MLVDRYPPAQLFALVPQLMADFEPVLRELDRLLDDDEIFTRIKADLARRAPFADGLGQNAIAPGKQARGLGGAGNLDADGRRGASVGMNREHQIVPLPLAGRPQPSNRQAYALTAQRTRSQ